MGKFWGDYIEVGWEKVACWSTKAAISLKRVGYIYRVFQKTVPLFYFYDNFRKWTPILTIFSPLEPEIYDA